MDTLVLPPPGINSLVAVYTSLWAQHQVDTFISHPDIVCVLGQNKGRVQRVDLNIEQNKMKAFLTNLFVPRLRRQVPSDRHDKG